MANLQGNGLQWLCDVDNGGLPWGVKLSDGREIPIVSASTAADAAALKNFAAGGGVRRFNPVEMYAMGSGVAPWSNNGNAGTTWQLQLAHRGKPYAIQVGYYNPTTSAYTVDKTTVTPSATFAINGDPTGTPVNVTFTGSASVTVPAAVANGNELVMSDWMPVAPVPRTDVTTSYYLSYIRSYIALANHPYGSPSGNMAGYTGNTTSGLVRNSGFQIADKIATPAGFTSNGGLTGYHLPIIVNARTLGRVVNVLAIGDSLTAGQPATDGGEYNSALEKACNLINNQSGPLSDFYSLVNMGTGNQTFTMFHARLAKILTVMTPDIVVMPVWCPNVQITTQAGFDASMAILLDSLARVRAAGAIPMLWTSSPKNSISAADDAWRKLANAAALNLAALGVAVCADIAAVTDNGATPGQWLPGLSADGLHANAAGTSIEAAVFKTALQSVIR